MNLLGLDAPMIAVIWLFLFAKTWRVNYHPWEAYAALGLAVWMIRIVAKLLEGSMTGNEMDFVTRHRRVMKVMAGLTGLGALVLTVLNFPVSVYWYLLVAGFFVMGYFALTLFSPQESGEISYSRHAMGGVAFAFGTGLTAHVYLPNLGIQELFFAREFLCFAVLCLLAFSAIDLWERTERRSDQEMSAADEISLSMPLTLLGATALVFAVRNEAMTARPFYYAILTGAALLQILNRTRGRFQPRTLKVLAAMSLLVPGVLFQTYRAN